MRSIRTFFIRFASRAWRAPYLAILAIALFPALSSAATIGSGYSGMWYDPVRSGEGLQLEILSPDVALVEWYTYDAQGKQRWIQGVGNITGDSIQFPQVYTTQGGKFGPAFNPDDVKISVVGNLSLTFGDCNSGTFKYTAFGQSQTLPIQRLTQTMGAGCAPINGVPGEPVMSYAGQSGSWYNTTRSGEGFDLQWLSNGAAIVTWYTYDANGNQVWLLGVGKQQDGAIVFDQMAITNGPKFGAAYDTTALQQSDWGSLTLTLDCNGGTAHYASNQTAFGSGDLTLTRLTYLQQPACPYVQPKFSDLYSVTWDEIPVSDGTNTDPNAIGVNTIANDGTIAGLRDGHLVLWHADTRTWEDIQRDLATDAPVFISPDGLSVVSVDGPDSGPYHTLLWQRQTGWQVLPSMFDSSFVYAVSRDFKTLLGGGSAANGLYDLWVGAIDGTQNVLPSPPLFGQYMSVVSNDGNTVLGSYVPGGDLFSPTIALRWDNGGAPTVMHSPAGDTLSAATACDANCGIVFGDGLYIPDNSTKPHSKEAWYLKNDGTFGYLGSLADAISLGWYYVNSVTPDGTLATGGYVVGDPVYGQAVRAFVWTQDTGIVSVRSLVAELGIGDDDWSSQFTANISADGEKILLSGSHKSTVYPQPDGYSRAVVLHLTPKASSN